jgi:hypothetical protein
MTEGLRPVQRALSPKEKLEILPEGVATDNTTEVCRRRGITVNLYYNWRARPLRDIGQVFAHGSSRAGFSQLAALDDRRRVNLRPAARLRAWSVRAARRASDSTSPTPVLSQSP